MKNFGYSLLAAGVFGAALVGYAAPAVSSLGAESSTTISADGSHIAWLDQINAPAYVPQVDSSVHQSR